MSDDSQNLSRYERQMMFGPLGLAGQRRLAAGRALVVGVGGLGSWTAQLLARGGVGRLRLVDDDRVELINVHRQGLYDESDAREERLKVQAAQRHLARMNSQVQVEAIPCKLTADNIAELAHGMDLILDGSDNFAVRFIINDYCVRHSLPWVMAGVVASEGQVMAIRPPATPCLRCVYDTPAPPCADPSCRLAGVLGPAVAAISAIQAMEAIKILSGAAQAASPCLVKLDLWAGTIQRLDLKQAKRPDCPCCAGGRMDYLEA